MLSIIRDQPQWDALYARLHRPSIVASYDYVNAAAQLENGGYAELAVWSDDDDIVFHPYIRRQISGGSALNKLVSAWEFGGFWPLQQISSINLNSCGRFRRPLSALRR